MKLPGASRNPVSGAGGNAARGRRCALAAGKRVFVVSDYTWSFGNHPRCRIFATLEAAIVAIMAGAQGARLRVARGTSV